jgi:hypothetical protein
MIFIAGVKTKPQPRICVVDRFAASINFHPPQLAVHNAPDAEQTRGGHSMILPSGQLQSVCVAERPH